ncbi:MAG: CHAT domain-containing protein [Phormidesmis sp.]
MIRNSTYCLTGNFSFYMLRKLLALGLMAVAVGVFQEEAIANSVSLDLQAQQTLLAQTPGTLLETTDALELGAAENGEIYDEFTFQGRAGQEIVITATREELEGTSYIESILFDPDGNRLTSVNASCFVSVACGQRDDMTGSLYDSPVLSGGRFTLPKSGSYRIRVQTNADSFSYSQISTLPYQLSVRENIDGYILLEEAETISAQAFGLTDIANGQIGDFDPAAQEQFGALVSQAFQIFSATNDTAGQQFILLSYPQYATASTGDDTFLQDQYRYIGALISGDPTDVTLAEGFEPSDFDYTDLATAEEEKLALLGAAGTGNPEYAQVFRLFNGYIGSGQYQQALESLQTFQTEQLARSPEQSDAYLEDVLFQTAWTYSLLGDYEKSNEVYRESLASRAQQASDQIADAPVESNLPYEPYESPFGASIKTRQAEFATLANSNADDLQFFLKSAKAPYAASRSLPMVAFNYYEMGDYEAALAITEALQQEADQILELQAQEFDASIPYATAAFAQQAGGGSSNQIVRAFVLSEVGRHSEAIALAQQVIDLGNTSLDSVGGPNGLIVLGKSYYATNNFPKATETYEQLLIQAGRTGDLWSQAYAYSRLAEILSAQGQPELAIAFYKKSVNTREGIRASNAELSPELRLSFVETISDDYRALAGLLLQQDRVFEAQEVLDLLRVQELDDYLRTVRADNPVNGILNYWDAEKNMLSRYAERVSQPPTTPLSAFAAQGAVQSEVQTLQRAASTQVLNPNSLERLRDNLAALDQAALLYPLVLEDRLEIILVTPDELVRKTVAVSAQALNQEISQFRRDLLNVSSNPQLSGNQLYRRLIEPIEAELAEEGITTLLYAADSQLRYVPLSALHTGEKWLAQQYSVNQITAASLTDFSAPDSNQLSVLAGAFSEGEYSFDIGSSRFSFAGLPFAGKEVEEIKREVDNSETYFNQQFNPNTILPKMGSYGVVHFATHAAFLPGSPNNSFILFGNGDRVSLRDIADWDLPNVDLIVLSACQTAVSEDFGSGDEILGFGYQMQQTGARAAIASLWQVDDGGTQVLMNAFYLALENGFSKAEALQRAQQALINDDLAFVGSTGTTRAGIDISGSNAQRSGELKGDSAHPYYWAPFILIGNGL